LQDITNFVRPHWLPFRAKDPINNGPTACNTTVSVSISFGGRLWLINPADMNTGPVAADPSQCLGAIYTLNPGSNTINTDGTANWIFGTAFMVSKFHTFAFFLPCSSSSYLSFLSSSLVQ
jgi:cathepsin D